MKHESGTFLGYEGQRLFKQSWQPEADRQACLVLVHGLGEHSGRFMNLVAPLVEQGVAVHSFDLRGHGRSSGKRGHIETWLEFRQDLNIFIEAIARSVDDVPIFLYGHSLGSLIVLDALIHLQLPLRGAIVSGVALDPAGVGTPLQMFTATILSKIWPSFSLETGLDPAMISSDPAVVEAYRADPLVHSRASVRFAVESLAAIERIQAGLGSIRLPFLLLHGEADELTTTKGAEQVMAEIGSEDKQLKIYPGIRHEPHNDLAAAQAAQDIAIWIQRRS